MGADTTGIAQRRVALLLLPLRLWIGLGWLRAGIANALQPEWLDGTALIGFLHGQAEAGTAPLSLYTDLISDLAARAPTPLGMIVVAGQIAIGLGLITGTLTNLALLMAILINVNLILAGVASPSQYYIVIEVVLLAGGAGAAYSVDRWLSRYLGNVMLTGHRGLVDGVKMPRSALMLLALATAGLAVAAVPTVGAVLPEQGVDDPGFTLLGLLLLVALLAMTLTRATHRAADPGAVQPPLDDPLGLGFPSSGPRPVSPPVPRRPAPQPVAVPPQGRPANGHPVGEDWRSVSVPPQGRPANGQPVGDDRGPVSVPPRGRPVDGRPARDPRDDPSDPWASPSPLAAPVSGRGRPGPAPRDQPTTQFVRQRRSRTADRAKDRAKDRGTDPYDELRDLPPHHR
jgi:uncharacterized membrane protein YphA (DoxX/SURF4 family)